MKKVICIETGEVFDSLTQAGERLGCSRQAIHQQLKGLAKICCGVHFKYLESKEEEITNGKK